MSRVSKTFEPGELVEVLRESWMSAGRFEPATYESRCDTISSRESYHRIVLPDSAPPMYVINGLVFDTPGEGRTPTRRIIVPSRRIRKRKR